MQQHKEEDFEKFSYHGENQLDVSESQKLRCFDKDSKILDQISNKIGYDDQIVLTIVLVFFLISIEGLHMTFFSTLILPIQQIFLLKDHYLELLSGILFAGVGIGSALSGYMTSKYGRKFVINFFVLTIFFSNLILAFTINFFLFSLFRFIIGLSMGLIIPTSINLLTEKLPLKYRSIFLNFVWIGFNFGNLFLLVLVYYIMPNYEISGFKRLLLTSSFLSLFVFILCIIFLEDSYRNLILKGNQNKAFDLIEKKLKITLTYIEKNRIYREIAEGANKVEGESIITEISTKKFKKLTILLIFIWFINSVISYGPMVIYTLTIKDLKLNNIKLSNYQVLINQIYFCILNSPSNVIGGFVSEIPFLGRNKSTLLSSILGFIFMLLAIINPVNFTFYLAISQAFVGIAFNINGAYSSEVYPTKIRDHIVGILFAFTRLGGFTSQFLYLDLYSLGIFIPYFITLLFMFVNILLIWTLPYETFGKPLDDEF